MSQTASPAAPPRRNLVLGALSSRKIAAPRTFIETLKATGADADITIFIRDIAPETERYLRDHGVTLIPFRHWRPWNGPVHAWRFVLFARYAAAHQDRYNSILVSDLRDVLFQSDPFAGLDDRRVHFFLEGDEGLHRDNPYYVKWLRIFASRGERESLWLRQTSCCGVTIGGAPEMTAYLEGMSRWIRRIPPIIRQRIGADSIAHNVLAHLDPAVPGTVQANNRLVATMGTAPRETYHIDGDGRIADARGHVSPICHQYDRWPDLIAKSRYATP